MEVPVQRIMFLGFKIDTIEMTVALTRERVFELNDLLTETILHAKVRKRKLQSIIGKLNCCTQVLVVYRGKYFLCRLINVVDSLHRAWTVLV